MEHDDKLALQSVALSEFAAFFLQRDKALLADGAKKKSGAPIGCARA